MVFVKLIDHCKSFIPVATRLKRDKRGFAALLLALTFIPLLTATGIAMEYGQMSQSQSLLNAAADSAALAATTTAANNFSAGTANYIAAGQAAGTTWFNSQVAKLNLPTPSSVNVQITQSGTVFNTTLTYTAQMTTNFGNFFGQKMFSMNGQSNATITVPGFLDIHVLMDVSSSMDIIANPSDVATFYNALTTNVPNTQGKPDYSNALSRAQGGPCAFACHYNTALQDLTVPDLYDIAHIKNIPLRIDVLRSAVENLIQTMISANVKTNFRAALYEFNTSFTTILGITSNLQTALADSQQIDTPVTNLSSDDTDFANAMKNINSILQNGGDGMSAVTPKEVLFIITDGVNNNNTEVPQVQAFDPSQCTALKQRGVRIEVLYTPYYPVYQMLPTGNPNFYPLGILNYTYVNEVVPIMPEVQTSLQSCATSPSDFFTASDTASINAALQQMLQASLATPGRYTK